MRACVCIWYCSISVWRSFNLLLWKHELVVAVISNVHVCETEFCILASPAIWWRSLKLVRGSVTFGSHGLTRPSIVKDVYVAGCYRQPTVLRE